MSRAYNIKFETCASDSGDISVKMLPILGRSEMDMMLREELKREGWKENGKTLEKDVGDGIKATLSEDGSTVKVEATMRREGIAVSDTDYSPEKTKEIVEAAKARQTADLEARLTERISRGESQVTPELDAAVQRVYVEALKKKAASMGNIESVLEGRDASGRPEVTIKVSV